jgi:hypothetical protein
VSAQQPWQPSLQQVCPAAQLANSQRPLLQLGLMHGSLLAQSSAPSHSTDR